MRSPGFSNNSKSHYYSKTRCFGMLAGKYSEADPLSHGVVKYKLCEVGFEDWMRWRFGIGR